MRVYIDQINENAHGVRIASLELHEQVAIAFTLPVSVLPAGIEEGDELELVLFRRDNSAELEAARKLMDELSEKG